MSTRNILSFMEILESLYQFAVDFDTRPGLKFLLQKVAGLEVAANQYRLAGASMILYLHTLTHLCSQFGGLEMESVLELLARAKIEEKEGLKEAGKCGEDMAVGKAASESGDVGRSEGGSDPASGSGNVNESVKNVETLPPVDKENSMKNNHSAEIYPGARCSNSEPDSAHSSDPLKTASQPSRNPPSQPPPAWKRRGLASLAKAWDSADVFLPMLQAKCDSICKQYIDILSESQTESLVDRMCGRPLFFLLAQPEDINEITRPLLQKQSDAVSKGEKAGGSEAGTQEELPSLAGTVVSSPQLQNGEFSSCD